MNRRFLHADIHSVRPFSPFRRPFPAVSIKFQRHIQKLRKYLIIFVCFEADAGAVWPCRICLTMLGRSAASCRMIMSRIPTPTCSGAELSFRSPGISGKWTRPRAEPRRALSGRCRSDDVDYMCDCKNNNLKKYFKWKVEFTHFRQKRGVH